MKSEGGTPAIPWTDEQEAIITAPTTAKILVEAGPGTGKTAVACGRVAHLLKQDVNPSAIMMVSFTRTAVAEMRSRIQQWSGDGLVSSVNVTTLDSAAFRMGMGCGAQYEKLMGSFEGNIENALKSFGEKNETLLEYLARFEHIILDEAQDLTGARTQLATLLLDQLSANAGVTVFADRAQAIYGFTNDVDDKAVSGENFLADYPFAKMGYTVRKLEKIHRTRDKLLLEFFGGVRSPLFNETVEDKDKPHKVWRRVSEQGKSVGREIKEIPLKDGDLVLFRKRVSALMAAQFHKGPVRLRLPGYPAAVFAWVGLVLSEWMEPEISSNQFHERWKAKVPAELSQGWRADKAWQLLLEHARAPRERVDVRKLRGLVARSRPPVELCHPDYGDQGPIFSTIHASKGREADRVFLMLPGSLEYVEKGKIDPAEEARVYYVGATRVKREFFHGLALAMVTACKLDTAQGRVVNAPFNRRDRPGFQFGLAGDIDESACISKEWSLCHDEISGRKQQADLVELWLKHATCQDAAEVTAKNEKLVIAGKEDYRYRLVCEGKTIGWTGVPLNADLWKAANLTKNRTGVKCGMRPPDQIEYLKLTGLRTCALPTDAASGGTVREPFATSGFHLAPMVAGFSHFFFPFYKNW